MVFALESISFLRRKQRYELSFSLLNEKTIFSTKLSWAQKDYGNILTLSNSFLLCIFLRMITLYKAWKKELLATLFWSLRAFELRYLHLIMFDECGRIDSLNALRVTLNFNLLPKHIPIASSTYQLGVRNILT